MQVHPCSAPVKLHFKIIDIDTGEIVRYAGLEYHCELGDADGLLRRTRNAKVVTEAAVRMSGETVSSSNKHFLSFEYANRVLFGTDNVPDDWPAPIKAELKSLAATPRNGIAKVPLPYDPKVNASIVSELLKHLNSAAPRNYFAPLRYQAIIDKRTSTKFKDPWDELTWAYGKERKVQVYRDRPVSPVVHCFGSPEEARLRLTHGRYADYFWEKKLNHDISVRSFKGAFVKTRSNTVVAFLRKTDPEPLPRLNDKMALEVSFNAIGYTDGERCMKTFRAIGQLTINELGVECTLVLLLRRVPKRMLEKAEPISHVNARSLDFETVNVTVKDYDQAKLQIQAINNFFRVSNPIYRKFWLAFMGIDSPSLKSSNFLTAKLGVKQRQIDTTVAGVRQKLATAGMVLNLEQDEILRKLGVSYGGWRLIRGPPGTGKSTLIAIIACALLQFAGTGVLLVAPSNGAASKLYGSIKAVQTILGITDPDCQPLRLFRKYYEMDHFFAYFDPEGSAEIGTLSRGTDEEIADILEDATDDWYTRQLEAEDRRLMDDPSNGLMAAVIQAFEDNNLHETGGAQDVLRSMDPKHARQRDHYLAARNALQKLRPYKERKVKEPSRRDLQGLACDVANHVIGPRRIIVCTADMATSWLARESIFRDVKSLTALFDEQTLATEASTLSVAAGTINWQRVTDEFAGKTPLDSMMLVGDEKQGVPLVQSQQDHANLFGPQMELSTFERLVKVGVPVDTLLEQHRMVPFLRELPSHRCYGDKLRDALEVQSRMLSSKEQLILRSIIHERALSAMTSRRDENRELRHLLLDVPDTEEGKEKETSSRLNMSNISVTIDLVKYLVLEGLVTPREIIILTFYNAQKKEYIRALSKLESDLGLKKGDFDDCVETADSFQGRERKCVILDFVVTYYSQHVKMGNVSNERKMNVACTRARDFFFVVARADILNSYNIPGGRLEYGLELLKRLKDRRALVDISVLKRLAKEASVGAKVTKYS